MDTTSYIQISHMTALRRQMDMIANNLANMSTPSYKGEKPLFTEFLNPGSKGQGKVSYVEDFGMVRNLELGTISPTGNPLDIAINGEGYFSIQTQDGIRYTRAGAFMLSAQGQIVTRQGDPVLDTAGRPIAIPPGTRDITISSDGTISADNLQLARIVPVSFEDERALKKLPNSLFETDQVAQPLQGFELRQGMIEGSNVQPVLEMTQMIDVSRAYQSAQRFVETEHRRIKDAIGKLAGNA